MCPNKGDGRQQADEASAVPQVERCLHHGGCKCEFNVERKQQRRDREGERETESEKKHERAVIDVGGIVNICLKLGLN